METKFAFQELDQFVYNKLLFYLDRQEYKVDRRNLEHTVEYSIYRGDNLLGVFKITQRSGGVVEYVGNGSPTPEPELSNSWNNLYYKMLIPLMQQEERSKEATREVVSEITGIWELPVAWDVLAAASRSCLDGYAPRGWVEKEVLDASPASITYRICQEQLGELGTVEIRKLRDGLSQIEISGVPLGAESLPDWEQTAEKLQGKSKDMILKALEEKERQEANRRARLEEHQSRVVRAYFSRLQQEDIWPRTPEPRWRKEEAGKSLSTLADNLGGTVTYRRNDQGQTIIEGGIINQGYHAELGQGVAIKPDATVWLNHTTGNFQPRRHSAEDKDEIVGIVGETLTGLLQDTQSQSGQADVENPPHTVKRGKSGRPHLPDDLWAWEQVNKLHRPTNEVKKEWIVKVKADPERRNNVDLSRHFSKIIKPNWRTKPD